MSQWNYVVTAHKPSNVTQSVTGHFTQATDLNLLIAKCTRVEVQTMTPEGLQPLFDIPVYGRIATMELFRPNGAPRDLLFLCTERHKFCVLEYDPAIGQVVTRANGDVQDRIGRLTDNGQIGHVDPESRLIGLHIYDGLFKIIPINPKGQLSEAFNIRLEELHVLDIQFLHGCENPTIVILFQDPQESRHLKTYEISGRDKDFVPGPWSQSTVEAGAAMLVAVPKPFGGCLLIGEHSIVYFNGQAREMPTLAMRPADIRACAKIDDDGSRYLISDQSGVLSILVLEHDGSKVVGLSLQALGETSCASTLSYLDNGVVFVGSSFGDSQLIKLHVDKDERGSNVEVLETFTNLGPIGDFCVVDLERQGQGQVVTCSGAFKDGSLRVIRNGIGINEQAAIELPGIKGMWSLRPNLACENDKYLVQSFMGETRILGISDEELEETEFPGFEAEAQSIYCGNAASDTIIQITERSIRLVACGTFDLIHTWTPPEGARIAVASANQSQVVVSLGSGKLVFLELEAKAIKEAGTLTLEQEISCITVNPLNDGNKADLCVVGLWDMTIRIINMADRSVILSESLGIEVIPRSVMAVTMEGVHYVLCGLGDGHLLTYHVDETTGALKDRKKVSLGTQAISLNLFTSKNTTNIFACSDRPTVVYSSNSKLMFSNVNLKEATHMCPFNSEGFPESLAIASESALTIGTIDDIQKLHIRTIPLGEHPRRICHMEHSRTFCVSTLTTSIEDSGEETESHFIKLFDDQTFELLAAFELDPCENCCSCMSMAFGEEDTPYLVVGTASVFPQEPEPTRGRILVFSIVDRELRLVTEKEVKGAVYSLNAFQGKLLASFNSKIQLFKWTENKELDSDVGYPGHILVLFVESRGDFIVVGDLMRSISLLTYKAVDGQIEEIARDFNPNWMTAIDILDEDTYLGAENHCNLFTVKKNTNATSDEERSRLQVVGEYHLGEMVNRFRHGSLVMQMPASEGGNPIPTKIFGTVNGVIGIIASLQEADFKLMAKVQEALTTVIKGVGGFSHKEWRSFCNERKTSPAQSFLDGDLIESFLDLPREKMEEIAAKVEVSVEELCKKIEELQQLH